MRRSRILVIVAIIGLLAGAFASLSTVRARQDARAEAARSADLAARAHVVKALRHAQTVGLFPSELAPYRQKLRVLDDRQEPVLDFLSADGVVKFHHSRLLQYKALRHEIKLQVKQVAAAAKAQATQAVALFSGDLQHAVQYGADVSSGQSAFDTQQKALSSAHTPGAWRAVSSQATQADRQLKSAVSQREQQVDALVKQFGTVSAFAAAAQQQSSSASADFPLLGLLTDRVNAYGTDLQSLLAKVTGAPTPIAAAVAYLDLTSRVTQIEHDYQTTVPSKLIVVSTEQQEVTAYQDAKVVLQTPVTTGGPELPTDHGVFHIYFKASPFTFHSPWPLGSPYYYAPTPVQYWMPFDGGEGLHDASWRSNFGPGSNLAPTDLGTGNTILGTHGCVNLPTPAAAFIWNWAPVGTTVVVI